MTKGKSCYLDLKEVQANWGYSLFFADVKKIIRERVNPDRDKREKFPPKMYQRLFDSQKGICPWCDKLLNIPANSNGNAIDHADPNEQQFNRYSNLQLLHRLPCNAEKSSMSIQEQSKRTGRSFTGLIRTPIEDEV